MSKMKTVNVWDPLVRIGHWTLVIAFFTAYFTEGDFMTQHVWAGYTVTGVVFLRLIWGFVGGRYAKFNNFIYRPSTIFNYLKNLLARKPQHYIGHNPAGGLMVIALLFSLIATTVSGMKLYAIENNAGPFAAISQVQNINKPASIKKTDSNYPIVNEEDEEFWEEIHEIFVNLTLLLVFLHISGIIASSIIDKEKLVKAMFTGKKEIDDSFYK